MKSYICIDLKSFYASVECVERNLNPLKTNLVVADLSRTEKTICLAVSPSLKMLGISGRPRLFEVVQKVKEINKLRLQKSKFFKNKSYNSDELKDSSLELDYIVAKPRMSLYIKYSSKIYSIYLKYIAPEDIHVYSIDEVFIDVTPYLKTYNITAHEIATKMIKDVLKETGITATAGIGTNMYLAKVAMDIVAKKMPADKDGVRIAELNEISYRKELWAHQPLTDFWRVGRGIQEKLNKLGLYTMGDIARCSLGQFNDKFNADLLYKVFGINAELLIDHAWGYEPCSMKDVKEYKPDNNSYGMGQVLHCATNYEKTKLILKEMADQFSLDLVNKKLVTNQLILNIGYESLNEIDSYDGQILIDSYGRKIPKHAHGTINLEFYTSSTNLIKSSFIKLLDKIYDKNLNAKKISISGIVIKCSDIPKKIDFIQLDIFSNVDNSIEEERILDKELIREKTLQEAILQIKDKFGKNSILKAMNLEEGATMKERNEQIGGHKA